MRRFAPLLVLLLLSPLPAQKADDEGVLPVGADGKPLNLDFEDGTLKDWEAKGEAFVGQPIKGDTVHPRRNDAKSRHQGQYWIGGYEKKGDKPQGTLTSVPFKVTHSWASFLVGGGPHASTCVELVRKDTGKAFHRASGLEQEDLLREVVDLSAHKGKEIFIRVVDKHSGHWGHVNFDDFRFHAARPTFAGRPKAAQPDVYKHAGLKPKDAAAAMTVPPGFSVSLVAGEPDVRQPIAFCFDDRGRIWVAEAYSYPIRRHPKEGKDRILIFEDTRGDGTYDKRTVFMEGLDLVSGLEVGFGGVWIGAAPYLMYVPMKDDKPVGKPQILLDGWGYQDTHETLNTFLWGPDGWLYGCHGVFTRSEVGKPGTPAEKRVKINAGVWRYHPTRHEFEVFAHGTSNPWGLDFNDYGHAFVEACVIPHNWHIIQGGRYARQAGSHFNPHTYDDIKTIAEHRHYVGATPHGGNNKSDSVGGGHAHCGTMIYLGGTWPKEYRGQMFMGNIHGKRFNVDKLTPKGSGYVASRAPDFLLANDEYARFINLRAGPDGNVVFIDWYDKQACHHGNPNIWDRETGRIYRVAHKDARPVKVDLTKKTDAELADLALSENEWYSRHARRLLQERKGRERPDVLAGTFEGHKDETRRLRALWALHARGGLSAAEGHDGLLSIFPNVRGWTIQLLLENRKPAPDLLKKLAVIAAGDRSPVVRLYLASACQRLPLADRWQILAGLVSHAEDATDHNLPLMYWYAMEPLASEDAGKALELAAKSKVPILLPFMIRRISSLGSDKAVTLLVQALGKAADTATRLAYLDGIQAGLKGARTFPMPEAWKEVGPALLKSSDASVRERAVRLAALFGDRAAFAELRRTVKDDAANVEARRASLAALIEARDAETAAILRSLLKSPELRGDALRGLAAFDAAETPAAILAVYASLNTAERRDAIATLSSRKEYARALLAAVGKKTVPAAHISSEAVRQLGALKDAEVTKAIGEFWGVVRTTAADRQALIKEWAAKARRNTRQPDLEHGRALFNKTCVQCHTLFGTGGKVGPDITGANRASLDYLLENILDPSAVIPKEYALTVLTMRSGRILSGIIRSETEKLVTLVTPTEVLELPPVDIEKREPSPLSMMPDDALKGLKDDDVFALLAYLQSSAQVPYLANADNAKDLFNGVDLKGWDGDPKLWKVVDGEIVGKTAGLKKNEFLRSQMSAADFKLTLKVKLTPDAENSGIQLRSEALAGGDVKGPQADVGKGWWGKLYEEHGRGLLWKESGEAHVKPGEWNEYVIEANGSKVTTWINGKKCVDLDDAKLSRRGIFAFQLHSGGAMEVRFKEIKLEVPGAK